MDEGQYRALFAPLRLLARTAGAVPDYPPATEEQLRATEERLGFALPPALRALYAEVANGGDIFRDHYVIYGAVGGFPRNEYLDGGSTIDRLVSRSGWRLHERVDAALRRHPGAFVQCERPPDRFVSIADLGCSMTVELDGWSWQLYVAGCGQDVHSYRVGQGLPPPPDSERAYLTTINYFASSFEDWIQRKLAVPRLAGAPIGDHPYMPVRELAPEMTDEEDT